MQYTQYMMQSSRLTPDAPNKKKIITINSHSHNNSNPASQHVSRDGNLLCILSRFFCEHERQWRNTTQLNFPLFLRFFFFAPLFCILSIGAKNLPVPLKTWFIFYKMHTILLCCFVSSLFYLLLYLNIITYDYIALVFISIK